MDKRFWQNECSQLLAMLEQCGGSHSDTTQKLYKVLGEFDSVAQGIDYDRMCGEEISRRHDLYLRFLRDVQYMLNMLSVEVCGNPFYNRYNITSKELLTCNAFVDLLVEYLKNESPDTRTHHVLLVPRLCRRIKAFNVFHGDAPNDTLLMIDLPKDNQPMSLYSWVALCHEVGHFVGDHFRLRPLRTEKYINTVAELIAVELLKEHQKTVKGSSPDAARKEKVRAAMEYMLTEAVNQRSGRSDGCLYMRELSEIVNGILYDLFNTNKEDPRNGLLNLVYSKARGRVGLSIFSDSAWSQARYTELHNRIADVNIYFTETYADLVAINCMGLTYGDYVNSFFENERYITPTEKIDYRLQHRVSFVANAKYREPGFYILENLAEDRNESIQNEVPKINGNVKANIVAYLKECDKKLQAIKGFSAWLEREHADIYTVLKELKEKTKQTA